MIIADSKVCCLGSAIDRRKRKMADSKYLDGGVAENME